MFRNGAVKVFNDPIYGNGKRKYHNTLSKQTLNYPMVKSSLNVRSAKFDSFPGGGYSLPFYTGGPCQYLGSEILQQNHIWGL